MLFKQDIMLSERHIKLFGGDIKLLLQLNYVVRTRYYLSKRDIKLFGRDIKLL